MSEANSTRYVSMNSGDNTEIHGRTLYIDCPFCSASIPHHQSLNQGCDCGATLTSEVQYSNQEQELYLHLHAEEDHTTTAEDSQKVVVECPFCDEWKHIDTLYNDGCDCGATVEGFTKFEKNSASLSPGDILPERPLQRNEVEALTNSDSIDNIFPVYGQADGRRDTAHGLLIVVNCVAHSVGFMQNSSWEKIDSREIDVVSSDTDAIDEPSGSVHIDDANVIQEMQDEIAREINSRA